MATKSASESLGPDPRRFTEPRPSKVYLVPYSKIDGRWTIADSALDHFYQGVIADGTASAVFSDGSIATFPDFVRTARSKITVFAFMDQAGMGGDRAAPEAIIGYGWLDSITPRSASCHFCVRKWAWGKVAREAGLLVNRYWFSFQGEDGPCFHVLLGMVAADNRHAIRFIRDIGWHEVGRVPKFLHGLKDGILFYRTRD